MLDFLRGEPFRLVIDLPRQARDRARFFGQRGLLNPQERTIACTAEEDAETIYVTALV